MSPFLTFPRNFKKKREMRHISSNGDYPQTPTLISQALAVQQDTLTQGRRTGWSVGMVVVGCDQAQACPMRVPIQQPLLNVIAI